MIAIMNNLNNKRLFLLDMDGTVYLDNTLFDGTIDLLKFVKNIGGRYLFLTNNSSKSVDTYIEKLSLLGIESDEDDFLTSTNATIVYLNNNFSGKKVYALGTKSFRQQLFEEGINITTTPDDGVDVLLLGYDTELEYKKLEDACILLGRGVHYIATNPDWVCPTWYGFAPDCGCIAAMLKNATGRWPVFIGKPQPEMIYLAMKKTGFLKEETIIIGDRIYTDIKSGLNAGVCTALVLSGETTKEMLSESEDKPDLVFENINEIYKALKDIWR